MPNCPISGINGRLQGVSDVVARQVCSDADKPGECIVSGDGAVARTILVAISTLIQIDRRRLSLPNHERSSCLRRR